MGESTEQLSMDIAHTRARLSADVDELGDKVSPSQAMHRRTRAVRNRFGRLKDHVMGTTQDVGSSLGNSAQQAGDSVGQTASSAAHGIERRTEGSPLVAGLVAFGAGMLLSAAFPATEAEQRIARQGVEAAKEHGQPVMDEVKSAASDIGQDLKESAREGAEEVKSAAQSSAENVRHESQSAAQHLKEPGSQT